MKLTITKILGDIVNRNTYFPMFIMYIYYYCTCYRPDIYFEDLFVWHPIRRMDKYIQNTFGRPIMKVGAIAKINLLYNNI